VVSGLEFRIWKGIRVQDLRFTVWVLGFIVYRLSFGVKGLGFGSGIYDFQLCDPRQLRVSALS